MPEFPFAKTPRANEFCHKVKAILQDFGHDEKASLELMLRFWGDSDIENGRGDQSLIYHELPYYWAMCMMHHPVHGDNQPDWHRNPTLWPPPNKYQAAAFRDK